MRKVMLAGVMAVFLVACSGGQEQEGQEGNTPESASSIQEEVAASEAKYATYPDEMSALIDGRRDSEAVSTEGATDLPGWSHQYWESTAISDSADLWFNPNDRGEFFLTLDGFHGELDFPGAATYLVGNEVETQSEAPQATYWCVTSGPYAGSALSTSFSKTNQTVFLKSPGFLALRPDYPCE